MGIGQVAFNNREQLKAAYRVKRRGPRQDPCGTPYFTSNLRDVSPLIDID
jgi:hypothetical protein